ELTAEAAADRARRIITETVPQIEDLLAGGADMGVLAERTDMESGRIEWNQETFDGIAAYDAFRSAAASAQPGAFPDVIELDDGGIFALTVDEVRAPEPIPFDEVRDEVIAGWETAETEAALVDRAELLAAGDLGDSGLALETDTDLARDGFLEGTPPDFIETLFAMTPGDVDVLSADGDAWVLRLDAINPPDATTDEAAALRDAFAARTAVEMSTGLIQAYTQAILDGTGVSVNQSALNAVNAQLP
ncbi:MAG: peptidylprolyl isomerase, partial [Silicimonas sp.]|nr:peptidylprolyl isomerase [Silicimonas sp.]